MSLKIKLTPWKNKSGKWVLYFNVKRSFKTFPAIEINDRKPDIELMGDMCFHAWRVLLNVLRKKECEYPGDEVKLYCLGTTYLGDIYVADRIPDQYLSQSTDTYYLKYHDKYIVIDNFITCSLRHYG